MNVADQTAAVRSDNTRLQMLVLLFGFATSGAALFSVYWLRAHANTNVMGWYASYIIPVGSLLVGIVAASGYGLASWLTGVKMRSRMLITVSLFQIIAYAIAHYVDFASQGVLMYPDGTQVTFFDFYHYETISFAWIDKSGKMGSPVGLWGYGLRALEIVGFTGGGAIVPAILMSVPYCDDCHIYMKTRELAQYASSIPIVKIKKNDAAGQEAHDKAQEEAHAKGLAHVQSLNQFVTDNNAAAFKTYIEAVKPEQKAIKKLPRRVQINLISCKCCAKGHIIAALLTVNGDQVIPLELSKTELPPEFVRQIAG